MGRRTRHLLLVATFALACALAFSACGRNGKDGDEQVVHVIVDHDRWGEIAPCGCPKRPAGGLARFVPSVMRSRENAGAVVVEAGDMLYPPARRRDDGRDHDARAAFIKDAMAKTTFDVVVPGELDFENGFDDFLAFRDAAKLPVVVANIVDPETGAYLFETHRIVERDGVRLAFIGLAGPQAFAGAPSNADFDLVAWRDEHGSAIPSTATLLKKIESAVKAAPESGESGDAKPGVAPENLRRLAEAFTAGAKDGNGENADGASEPGDYPPPPDYDGPRFRVTDFVEAARREIDAIAGKADIIIAVAHMTREETERLAREVPPIQFIVDGHAAGKSAYGDNPEGANFLRLGSKGRTIGHLKLHIARGVYEFADRSSAESRKRMLDRYKQSWDRLVEQAGGKDPATAFDKDDRRTKRAERLRAQIEKIEDQIAATRGEGSWYEFDRVYLDREAPSDPALEARMNELEPPAERGAL
ncbi:hypothetical protein K8I61_00020 [bacterium]|nr:hypothetical protein [bacterium]